MTRPIQPNPLARLLGEVFSLLLLLPGIGRDGTSVRPPRARH
ncbi:hypothetical protein [Aerophototrophica crusticola]